MFPPFATQAEKESRHRKHGQMGISVPLQEYILYEQAQAQGIKREGWH